MANLKPVAHKVSIAGKVTDEATGAPAPGALVEIVRGPPSFRSRRDLLAQQPGWGQKNQRYDRTLARSDGSYYFVDLPNGVYRLEASAPAMGTRYGKQTTGSVRVWAGRDPIGRVKLSPADMALPATHVHGRVTNRDTGAAIAGAKTKLRGDDRVIAADKDGRYVLGPLTAGSPTLEASAKGFQTAYQGVRLTPGRKSEVNLALAPES